MQAQLNQNWQPATFQERGVAVGFTSPMLAGARLRVIENRHELVVPHPGGVRGVYIFSLASLTEFCAPTLYDVCLARRLQVLQPLTPIAVRLAARAVAAQGAAGRPAAAAALAAGQLDSLRRAAFEAALMVALTMRPSGSGGGGTGPCRMAETVRADVDLLADQLVGAGLDPPPGTLRRQTDRGRCAVLMEGLATLVHELRAWMARCGDQLGAGQVVAAAETVYVAGQALLRTAQAQAEDPAGLLASWAAAPEQLAAQITRPDWLLDGWEPLCFAWQLATTDDERAEAVAEIGARMPPFPREAERWFTGQPQIVERLRACPPAYVARRASAQPPSHIIACVGYNERLKALAQ